MSDTIIKINDLTISGGDYTTLTVSFPHSILNQDTKIFNYDISIKGDSQDDALVNFKLLLDELYKIKDESKACILEIMPKTTYSTFYEILGYDIISRDFSQLPKNNLILINLHLLVDNFGYSDLIAIGEVGTPHATKTLPDYFDISASKGDIPAFTELFMKLTSAANINNIYYGFKSEKLIADIADFLPILEAEDQTLVNATKASDNLNTNPSIEVNTDGYLAGGSVISRDIVEFYKGVASLKCITDNIGATEGWFRTITTTTSAGTEYTFPVYLKGSGTVCLRFWDDITGNQTGDIITLNGDWTRYSLTKTFGIGSTNRKLYIITNVQQAITFYSDAIMHTEGATLYPYYEDAAKNNYRMFTDVAYPTVDWATYITFSLNNVNYKGRYLVLIRCKSESISDDIIKIRLKYGNLYNDEYSFQATDGTLWRLIELGEIQVPYAETQTVTSDYEIQLIGDASDRIGIDYIALIPSDESFGIRKSELDAISQNEIYEIDTIKKIISTYVQDENDNNNYDRGNFIYLPKGDCRVVVVSDNVDENAITDQMAFWLNYKARYKFLRGD